MVYGDLFKSGMAVVKTSLIVHGDHARLHMTAYVIRDLTTLLIIHVTADIKHV